MVITRFITHIDDYDCGGCFSSQLVKITSLQFNEENDAGSVKLKMLGEVCQGRARLKAHDISRYLDESWYTSSNTGVVKLNVFFLNRYLLRSSGDKRLSRQSCLHEPGFFLTFLSLSFLFISNLMQLCFLLAPIQVFFFGKKFISG